jgi:hypothetical protein
MGKPYRLVAVVRFALVVGAIASGCTSAIESRGEPVTDWYTNALGRECRDYEDGSTWCKDAPSKRTPRPTRTPFLYTGDDMWSYFAPTVKTRIDATTSCPALLQEFEAAADGWDRAEAENDVDRMTAQASLVDYVYKRLERFDCLD